MDRVLKWYIRRLYYIMIMIFWIIPRCLPHSALNLSILELIAMTKKIKPTRSYNIIYNNIRTHFRAGSNDEIAPKTEVGSARDYDTIWYTYSCVCLVQLYDYPFVRADKTDIDVSINYRAIYMWLKNRLQYDSMFERESTVIIL